MAQRKFYVDLDLNKNELISAALHNVAVSGVTSPATGQVAFDTDSNKMAFYNGSSWETVGQLAVDTVNYKGGVAASGTVSSPDNGDMYIFTSAGTATNFGGVVVQSGDFAIYNGSSWDIIQSNIVAASETEAGYVELATDAEANTGSDTSRAITPANLEYVRQQKTFASVKEFTNQNISDPGTALTHNLNTKSVAVSVYDSSDNQIEVQVVATSVNAVTVTSNVALTGCRVVVVGYNTPV